MRTALARTALGGLAALLLASAAAAEPPTASPGGTIVGRVTRAGRPIDGVRVEVRRLFDLDANLDGYGYRALFERMMAGPDAWAPVATLVTDEAGGFAAHDLAPGVYDAETVAAGFAHASVTVPALPGARVEAHLALPLGAWSLGGRVRTADGGAFRGSLVWMTGAARDEFGGMTVRGFPVPLAAEGRFELASANAEWLVAAAVEAGRAVVFSEPVDPGANRGGFTFAVDEGFETLAVRVADAATGEPVPGAVVLAKGVTPRGGFAMVRAVADARGLATLRAVGGGRGEVWAYAPGYQETGVREVGGPGAGEVLVRMGLAARVVGRVVSDEDGKPVAGVEVHVVSPDGTRAWPRGHATTGADGRYAIEGTQAGESFAYAEGAGWIAKPVGDGSDDPEVRVSCVLRAGETATVDLRVVRGSVRRGRVLGPDGEPVTGALVSASLAPLGWTSFADGRGTDRSAASGPDGRWVLDGLPPGRVLSFDLRAAGFPGMRWTSPPDGPEVEVRLPRVAPVEVEVLDDATGRPVPFATVEGFTDEPSRGDGAPVLRAERWEGRTGHDGRLRIEGVPEHPRYVEAEADGYVGAAASKQYSPATQREFLLRLKRPTTVSGHVYLPDGTPAAGVEVECTASRATLCVASSKTTTDAAGAFRFDDAAPGEVDVAARTYASERGSAKARVTTRGGATDVELRLVPEYGASRWRVGGRTLTVHVTDAEGRPVPEADVSVLGPHGARERAWARDGRATVGGLARDATLEVTVADARDGAGRRLPLASARATAGPGDAETTVRLAEGRSVGGRVVGPEGKPVAGVLLAAVPPEALPSVLRDGAIDPVATSAADGTFRIGGLEEGPHVVLADPGASWVVADAPRVEAGAQDVVLLVRPAVAARVRVVDASDRPLEGARVRFAPSREGLRGTVVARTDASGTAVLGGLDPAAEGTLTAEDARGEVAPRTAWRPKDETLRLDARGGGATDVLVHADLPLAAGRNAVWCATSQLAWDALADAVGERGRLRLEAPAPPDLVERLNRRSFPHEAVDAGSCVAIGGLARDGVLERIAEAWRRTFGPDAAPPDPTLDRDDAVGVAGIRKELPFAQPFSVHPDAMSFAGGAAVLRAWGIRSYETGPGAEAAAEQVTAYVPPGLRPGEAPEAVVVEVRPQDPGDRIYLARVEPKATLEATWRAVDSILSAWTADRVEAGSTFVVPTIRLDVTERFRAFEGAPVGGIPDSRLESFTERLRFGLSERGASLAAESAIVLSVGIHPELVFDRPFLLALRRADATVPYFLLWVGNDALLERMVPPASGPLDPEALAALVGTWTLDRDRSREASVLRGFALLRGGELGFAPDAKPTPKEILARHDERYPRSETRDEFSVRLKVRPGGRFVLETAYGPPLPPESPMDDRSEGVVRSVEGKPALWLVPRATRETHEAAGEEPEREGPMPFLLRDGRVEIVVEGSTFVWVLERR